GRALSTIAAGIFNIRHFGDDGAHQAAAGDELRSLTMCGGQECLATRVDHGHAAQVQAQNRLGFGQRTLPASLRLASPGADQLALELQSQRFRFVMRGDPEHVYPPPRLPLSATLLPSMNTSSC